MNAVELRTPGDKGIRLAGVEHVAHGQANGIEVVLDAQELKRISAIAIDHFTLQFA